MTSLLEQASSGYDLARRFDKSIGHFWQATHQQIYRELARMERAGWISSEAAPDGGRTRKRLYSVLPAGRAELVRWVGEPAPVTALRDDLLVRLRADAAIGPLGMADEIRRRKALHESKLEAYRQIEAHDFPADKPRDRRARLHHLILGAGILYEQTWLAWCDAALDELSDDSPDSAPPATLAP